MNLRFLPFLQLILIPALAFSQPNPLDQFPSRVKKIVLKNGMRALIVERPDIPTVSFAMYIRTGGMDDEMGKSGLAHMFEHMLFKGTKTIGVKDYAKERPLLTKIDEAAAALQRQLEKGEKGDPETLEKLKARFDDLQKEHEALLIEEEYWQIYEQAGAQGLNASTGYDFTNYVISLPINRVELWMKMESDRIQNPVLREFYKERAVVLEERRQRIDNSPGGKLWEAFLATAFMAHPYGRPIVGWESDISRVTRQDALVYFKKHYDVSRLVVAIVGGVKAEAIEKDLRKYFEPIASNGALSEEAIPVEPEQSGERRVQVHYEAEPSLLIGYHRPHFLHPDNAALEVAADILDRGRTSRFYRTIIEKKRIGASAWAASSTPGDRAPSLFVLGGEPRSPHTTAELEKILIEEVERLAKQGPTLEELEKVKNNIEADVIRSLASNAGLANQLGYFECVAGDWKSLLEVVKQIQNVTQDDVTRVLRTYLVPTNKTVAILVKKKKGASR